MTIFLKKNFSDEFCPLPPSMLHLAPIKTSRHLAGSQNPMCRLTLIAMMISIRVGMAMMEVVVTDLKYFRVTDLKYFRVTDLSILQSGSNLTSSLQVKPHLQTLLKMKRRTAATLCFAHMTCTSL